MSTFEALLNGVRDDLEGDEPRLILADWLEDHDEAERAELIRVQVVLARLPDDHELRPELAARERGLLLLHEAEWADLPEAAGLRGEFRRGFLERLAVPARLLLREAGKLLGSGLVRDLEVRCDDLAEIEQVAELPGLRSVRALHLTGDRLAAHGLAAVLDSPFLQQLTALKLVFEATSRRALRRLGTAAGLRELTVGGTLEVADVAALLPRAPSALESLSLQWHRRGNDEGSAALAGCPHLGGLRRLSLNSSIQNVGVAALARAPWAAGLESLNLWGADLSREGLRLLLQGEHFPALARLLLRTPAAAWDDEPEDAGPARRPALRELDVSCYGPLPVALANWLSLSSLSELRDLALAATSHYAEVNLGLIAALATAPALGQVRRLALHAPFDEAALARLLAAPQARRWRRLELSWGQLAGELAPLLDAAPHLQLSRLALDSCNLGDDDAWALAECEWLSDLRELSLADNVLTNDGAEGLARSPYLRRLTSLDLSRNHIHAAQIFAGTYLANPAILNLADNPLLTGQEELLRSGAEVMRRVSALPFLALLAPEAGERGP